MREKKKTSTFTKITKVFVWLMIIVTLAGVVFGAISSMGIF
ncbi:DUF4044 domain-containing protein [Lapidilactobacillus achengensis]|uniref:DUF4044 domain-containing protein n=1 Tax=Lapidilactobacillus achengensis TaxID=2486000 RepID=A0ABW1UUK8_9LACO|nr:DUF4044 domain-containing protein [Lapidilactobacillus achengensis]